MRYVCGLIIHRKNGFILFSPKASLTIAELRMKGGRLMLVRPLKLLDKAPKSRVDSRLKKSPTC